MRLVLFYTFLIKSKSHGKTKTKNHLWSVQYQPDSSLRLGLKTVFKSTKNTVTELYLVYICKNYSLIIDNNNTSNTYLSRADSSNVKQQQQPQKLLYLEFYKSFSNLKYSFCIFVKLKILNFHGIGWW